jgi:hypothetical protein
MKEGVTTTMKRKKGQGLAARLHGLLRPSPIYMLDMPLFYTHLVVSISYLVAPHHGCFLSEALLKLLATNTWRSGGGGGVPADPYFRCPTGPRAWRTSPNHSCDRVQRHRRMWRLVHDRKIVKWTTMSTMSSERLRRLRASLSSLHRQCLCRNIIPASGLRSSRVSSPLLPSRRVFLASLCSCAVIFFVFHATNPSVVSEPSLCVVSMHG